MDDRIRLGASTAPRARSSGGAALSIIVMGFAAVMAGLSFGGCGSKNGSSFNQNGSGSSSGVLYNGGGGTDGGSNANAFNPSAGTAIKCDAGTNAACLDNSGCPNGGTTTITGTVYDPADINPLYNITVYIPGVPVSALPDLSGVGVQATIDGGAPFCSCDDFYPPIVADAVTDANGNFTITDAPYGTLNIVVQTGKWRMAYQDVVIEQCKTNQIPDKQLRLPRNASEGNLPNIAISTGGADSLECLPLRIGVDPAEYVGGNGGNGHIHIFNGYHGATVNGTNVQPQNGLWDQPTDLEQNDVVLLSCEGEETVDPNQASLITYANNGGRAFLSHYHYVWLRDAPAASNWNTLATWQGSNQQPEELDDTKAFPADVDMTFYEGQVMDSWLALTGGLTAGPADGGPAIQAVATTANCTGCTANPGPGAGQLPVWYSRHNVVTLTQPPATEWLHFDPAGTANGAGNSTQYFSFDTPLGTASTAETQACGRVVYSDLHVSGGPGSSEPPNCTGNPPSCYPADYASMGGGGFGGGTMQGGIVPSQCRGYNASYTDAVRDLSPQEKALEFMLFDLSSCLVPVNMTPVAPPTHIAATRATVP